MLKIKENVKLEVLEELGFFKLSQVYEYILPNPNDENDNQARLLVYENTRELYLFNDEFVIADNIYELDILFDLIHRGLIERVVEINASNIN